MHKPTQYRALRRYAALLLGSLAIHLGLAALAEAEEPTHNYAVAAQPLNGALTDFADQSNLKLMFPAELARGIASPGVTGALTRDQALARLLAGTGMTYRYTSPDTVTLERPDPLNDLVNEAKEPLRVAEEEKKKKSPPHEANTPTILEEITVTASPLDETSYNVPNATTATKTDTPIMETPVSIQVVPQAVLRDQAAIHLRDALKNVSGVQPDFSFGNLDARFTLRGFPTTEFYVSTGVYIDGFLMPFIPASLANIEQVEVLKGSAGALYGRIEPGGIINLKTKRPTRQPYYSVTQYLGSFDTYQTLADAGGPITQDESVLYRFNFEYLDADSFRDVVSTQRTLVAPSLTWNISDSTKLDVDFTYLELDNVDDFGIPARGNALVPIPRETFLGSLDDESNTKFYYGSLMLTHEFGPSDLGDWSTRVKFVKFNADEFFQETGFDGFLDPANPNILSRNLFRSDGEGFVEDNIFVAAELIGTFHTGFLNHTLLLGGEYYDREAHDNFFFASGAPFAPDIDITNPTLTPSGGIFTPDFRTIADIHEERFSFTLQDQVEIGKQLYLMAGARFDFADFEVSFDPNGIVVGRVEEEEVSPRFGLLYKPLPWLGVFGSFAQGFNGNFPDAFEPIEDTEPQRSEQFEVGLKLQTPDERFDATLAFYDLTEENIVVSDPDPALAAQGRTLQIGEGNSRGIELDVHGQITPEWDVIATYALTDTEITQDTSGLQGNRFPNSPLHSGSIFTKYKFSQVGLPGLSLAFGAYVVDERQGNRANSFQLPGYARFDLALAHRFEVGKGSFTLQLNVENLTDEEYFLNGGGSVEAFANPGASRTFLGSVRVEF